MKHTLSKKINGSYQTYSGLDMVHGQLFLPNLFVWKWHWMFGSVRKSYIQEFHLCEEIFCLPCTVADSELGENTVLYLFK